MVQETYGTFVVNSYLRSDRIYCYEVLNTLLIRESFNLPTGAWSFVTAAVARNLKELLDRSEK